MTISIYKNAKDMFDHSTSISPTNDFVGKINIFNEENAIIQTELFDIDSLRYYAKKNCGLEVSAKEKELYETEYGGGSQGHYSYEMIQKIEKVVDSLVNFHDSKRAVVMMNNKCCSHSSATRIVRLSTIRLNTICLTDFVVHISSKCVVHSSDTTIVNWGISPSIVCPVRID